MGLEFISPRKPSKCTWKPNGTNNPHDTTYSKPHDWKNVMPNILHAVGQTPMVKLNYVPKKHGVKCEMYAKCEFMNPGGSVKDRIALKMVDDAEKKGHLKPGYTIIEPTSGNTGLGLALVSAVKGYQCIIVISERFSDEKVRAMQALGAKIIRTPIEAAWEDPDGPFAVSQRLQKQIPNSVILGQMINASNPLIHYNQTATEIWEQCDGKIDYVVGGLGTGGTISGIGRKFRELSPNTKIVVSDPRKPSSNKYLDPNDQMHNVEGIGLPFTATVTDLEVIDIHVKTNEKECLHLARELIKYEGLLCGGSSGGILSAALSVAKDLPAEKRVVVIFPDTMRNYMNQFVSDAWMESKSFMDPPRPLKCNEWWWDLTVSKIPLSKPFVLANNITCEKALKFLQEKNINQTPIADENENIVGFITHDKLLSCLISGGVKSDDLAIKAIVRQFKKVGTTMTLGRLSRIIQNVLYAVVLDEDNDNAFAGVLTQRDLFNFISHQNKTISYT